MGLLQADQCPHRKGSCEWTERAEGCACREGHRRRAKAAIRQPGERPQRKPDLPAPGPPDVSKISSQCLGHSVCCVLLWQRFLSLLMPLSDHGFSLLNDNPCSVLDPDVRLNHFYLSSPLWHLLSSHSTLFWTVYWPGSNSPSALQIQPQCLLAPQSSTDCSLRPSICPFAWSHWGHCAHPELLNSHWLSVAY